MRKPQYVILFIGTDGNEFLTAVQPMQNTKQALPALGLAAFLLLLREYDSLSRFERFTMGLFCRAGKCIFQDNQDGDISALFAQNHCKNCDLTI